MNSLFEKLVEYRQSNIYPMHMPGHKRNETICNMPNPYSLDITEIDGFDNLHDAKDIIKESMDLACKLYGSKETFYLINGSTSGLIAGIMAATNKGDKVLVARNSHKSVYNAVYLHELHAEYLYPEMVSEFGFYGALRFNEVQEKLNLHPDTKLIIITSPTYEGVVSDIKSIVTLAHQKNIPVLVDEAHGAHLGFHPYFPTSAIKNNADIIIQSIHKTMPAFTQTALLHYNSNLIARDRIAKYLQMIQSTSPSYLLMASIDQCIQLIWKEKSKLFNLFYLRMEQFYRTTSVLKVLRIILKGEIEKEENGESIAFDPSKIVISTAKAGISGIELYHILLQEYGIQLEMYSMNYVIGMTSIADTEEGICYFARVLLEIDQKLSSTGTTTKRLSTNSLIKLDHHIYELPKMKKKYDSFETDSMSQEVVPVSKSMNRVCTEFIYVYPPGIPVLVPGEIISAEFIHCYNEYKRLNLEIKGLVGKEADFIKVTKE